MVNSLDKASSRPERKHRRYMAVNEAKLDEKKLLIWTAGT